MQISSDMSGKRAARRSLVAYACAKASGDPRVPIRRVDVGADGGAADALQRTLDRPSIAIFVAIFVAITVGILVVCPFVPPFRPTGRISGSIPSRPFRKKQGRESRTIGNPKVIRRISPRPHGSGRGTGDPTPRRRGSLALVRTNPRRTGEDLPDKGKDLSTRDRRRDLRDDGRERTSAFGMLKRYSMVAQAHLDRVHVGHGCRTGLGEIRRAVGTVVTSVGLLRQTSAKLDGAFGAPGARLQAQMMRTCA
eukprot:scaffold1889_cov333-Pavlova_lutheri.AAC.2